MDRKEISAFLVGCEPDELLAFKTYEDSVAVIGPDGKKYVYSFEYLDQAVEKKKAAEQAAEPAQPAKRKAPAKRAARKPASRSRTTKDKKS